LIVELDRDRIDHQEGADQWGIWSLLWC
jgi:hypothetical protein